MNAHQLAQQRYQTLNNETGKLGDLFYNLIAASKVAVQQTQNEREAMQTGVQAAQIVHSCEVLLQLVSELKDSILLYDFERLLQPHHSNVSRTLRQEVQALEDLTLADEQGIDESLAELEQHYAKSMYSNTISQQPLSSASAPLSAPSQTSPNTLKRKREENEASSSLLEE